MALAIVDRLVLPSPYGDSEIQFCCGDLTTNKEATDILCVSAFQGDYSPTPSSLIGAVKSKLGISVRDLAKAKELDMSSTLSVSHIRRSNG